MKGHWHAAHGEETLHKYYVDFDHRFSWEMETAFPENGVPDGLSFQDLDDQMAWVAEVGCTIFQSWSTDGKHGCDVAQALLHTWVHRLMGRDSGTLDDFFA